MPHEPDGEADGIGTIVAAGAVLLIGVAILGAIAGVGGIEPGAGVLSPDSGDRFAADEQHTVAQSDRPEVVDVYATTERAVQLEEGAYVDADIPDDWDNGSWSVLTAAELDSEADANAAYTVIAAGNGSLEIAFSDGEWTAYHERGNDSAYVSVPADSPTEGYTPVVVTYNDTSSELAIDVNGTRDAQVLDGSTPSRTVTWEWPGRIDEVRFADGVVSDAGIQTYQADPIAPLPDEPITVRYMFDSGSGDTEPAYFHGGEATFAGATWTSNGVPDPGLDADVDYAIDSDPFSVTVAATGYLDGAPVAYVSWGGTFESLLATVSGTLGSAMVLGGVLVLVVVAYLVVGRVSGLDGGRRGRRGGRL